MSAPDSFLVQSSRPSTQTHTESMRGDSREQQALARSNASVKYVNADDSQGGGCRDNRQYDCVYADSIGQATRADSFAVLGRYGHLVYFGDSSGPPASVRVDELYGRCLRVSAFWLAADPPERWDTARRDLQDWVVDGTLRITIGQTFPLQEASTAHRLLESRATHGKLILANVGSRL